MLVPNPPEDSGARPSGEPRALDGPVEDEFLVRVRARVEAITFEALDVVERGIRVGTPAAQHNLITRVLPVLIKTVTGDQSTDSELDALKETQAEIMKALHESVPHPPDAANPGS